MNTFEQRRQLAYYRAAFHDMPVAGPMDGAAYGEYLKSKGIGMIIGVVASVVTMGAALPMMAGTLVVSTRASWPMAITGTAIMARPTPRMSALRCFDIAGPDGFQ